jgi:uridine nucleosidase
MTTIFGNVTTEYATRNALFKGLCDRAGHPEVPIAEGSPEPLKVHTMAYTVISHNFKLPNSFATWQVHNLCHQLKKCL